MSRSVPWEPGGENPPGDPTLVMIAYWVGWDSRHSPTNASGPGATGPRLLMTPSMVATRAVEPSLPGERTRVEDTAPPRGPCPEAGHTRPTR